MATDREKAGPQAGQHTLGYDQASSSGYEKTVKESPVFDSTNTTSVRIGEAADVYGDIQTAEEYGYVERVRLFHLAPAYSAWLY